MTDSFSECSREERHQRELERVLAHLADVLDNVHDSVFGLPNATRRAIDEALFPFGLTTRVALPCDSPLPSEVNVQEKVKDGNG